MWDAFSRGCNDGCDSAAARRTTPLAFGAADREDEPNSARKSSVTWRVWNESACYETVMSIEWQGSCIDTDGENLSRRTNVFWRDIDNGFHNFARKQE